jgi:hypothetical protein
LDVIPMRVTEQDIAPQYPLRNQMLT